MVEVGITNYESFCHDRFLYLIILLVYAQTEQVSTTIG